MYGYHIIAPEYFKMQEVAKRINNKKFGKNRIFALLRKKGILNAYNQLNHEFENGGDFKGIVNGIQLYSGCSFGRDSCMVSETGIEFIKALILQKGEN